MTSRALIRSFAPRLLAIGVVLWLAFTAAIAAIHAQPLAAAPGVLLAANNDCPTPETGLCFLNIYPGRTIVETAIQQLQDNAWIAEVNDQFPEVALLWTWNGTQPSWLKTEVNLNVVQTVNDHVLQMTIPTNIQLGEIVLAYALSGDGSMTRTGSPPFRQSSYTARFSFTDDNGTWHVFTSMPCGVHVADYWRSPVELLISARETLPIAHSIPPNWVGARHWCPIRPGNVP